MIDEREMNDAPEPNFLFAGFILHILLLILSIP